MKKLYSTLKITLQCVVGVFAGTSIYQYIDYRRHPGLYALTSAPWYTSIQISGIFTVVAVLLLLLAMQIVKRTMK